jgi:hypothetical protein
LGDRKDGNSVAACLDDSKRAPTSNRDIGAFDSLVDALVPRFVGPDFSGPVPGGSALVAGNSAVYPEFAREWCARMRKFKWIEWNLQKLDGNALSPEDVEAAFDRVLSLAERDDGSFEMFAETPSGRQIWVIWRYDREDDEIPDIFGELGAAPIFVITAY